MSEERQNADGDVAEQKREKWHIGVIPAASLALALLVQTVVVVRWAATLEQRIARVEEIQKDGTTDVDGLAGRVEAADRLAAVLAERLRSIEQGQARIEVLLDRLYRGQNGGSSQ